MIFLWENGDVLSFDEKVLGKLRDVSLGVIGATVIGKAKSFDLQENTRTGKIYLRHKDTTMLLPNCTWTIHSDEFQFRAFRNDDGMIGTIGGNLDAYFKHLTAKAIQ